VALGSSTVLATALTACGLFGAGGYYSNSILNAPADPNSQRYVQSIVDAGDRGGFWMAADPAERINLADARTPAYSVRQKVQYHQFPVPYPWLPDFYVEPLSDAHAMVVQTQACELYETYQTTFSEGVLSAYSGAHWNLRRPFVPLAPGTPSAMASGLSLYAGMVRWEEVARGSIGHALNWAAPAGTVAQWNFVRPASDTDGLPFKGSGRYQLPYGARLRLRASFDTSRFGPQSAAIARAMKTYGVYLADTARTDELYDALALDGSNHWSAADLAALASIHITDFDVLSLGTIERVPGR
jgi:hypothetical protein